MTRASGRSGRVGGAPCRGDSSKRGGRVLLGCWGASRLRLESIAAARGVPKALSVLRLDASTFAAITGKTATLLSSAYRMGALEAGAGGVGVERAGQFGLHFGI